MASPGDLALSIIVPTLNEAENLPLLVPRIAGAAAGGAYEIIIVDDNSRDNTAQVCADLAKQYPLHLLERPVPKDGLSGAVLAGMKIAKGNILLVMDADLQHPPEKIPELVGLLESDQADFVIGSRYVPGGGTDEQWGVGRKMNSLIATGLAAPFAGNVRDPMAGFFALKRETYERAERLTPLGYKIGLELMCKCRVQRVREVPIHFGLRAKGSSKLTLTQQFKYLEHLSRLYDYTFPRGSPAIKFLIATAIAWFIALAFFFILLRGGLTLLAAVAIAYPIDILVTAIFHLRYVRTQREFIIRPHPWRDFAIISLFEWIIAMVTALWMSHRVINVYPVEVFVITFGLATLVRYVLRKEFLMDIRGLRKELRREEIE